MNTSNDNCLVLIDNEHFQVARRDNLRAREVKLILHLTIILLCWLGREIIIIMTIIIWIIIMILIITVIIITFLIILLVLIMMTDEIINIKSSLSSLSS